MAWNTYQEASNELLRRQIDDATNGHHKTDEELEQERIAEQEADDKWDEMVAKQIAEAKAKGEI